MRDLERMLARVARKVARRSPRGRRSRSSVEPENLAEMVGPERFFLEQARTYPRARRRNRACLDRSGRRRALRRSQPAARRPRAAPDWPARGRDARVGPGGSDLHLVACRAAGREPHAVPSGRAAYPRPGRRRPQGRPIGGGDHGDRPGIAVHRAARCAATLP